MSERELVHTEREFRQAEGLVDDQALTQWLEAHGLAQESFRRFIGEEALLCKARQRLAAEAVEGLPNYLLTVGELGRLVARAHAKRLLLIEQGLEQATPEDVGLSLDELVEWHVEHGCASIQHGEALARYARTDADGYVEMLLREYVYVTGTRQPHRFAPHRRDAFNGR